MATRGKLTRKKTSTTRKASAAGTVHSAAALRAVGKRRHDLQQSIEADRKQRADDYFDCRNVGKQHQRLIRQLKSLGVQVTVEEVREAA